VIKLSFIFAAELGMKNIDLLMPYYDSERKKSKSFIEC
jgi:hypothetical protein